MSRLQSSGENGQRSACFAATKPEHSATRRWPRPDRSVLSEAIKAYLIGRTNDGYWVARDCDRPIGGLFLLRSSAVAFAKRNCEPYGCALMFEPDCVELDVQNRGNPFIEQIGRIKRAIKMFGASETWPIWFGKCKR